METKLLNIAFLLLGLVIALIYYIDCWKPEEEKNIPKKLMKFKGLTFFLSSGAISALADIFDNYLMKNDAFLFYIVGFSISLVIYIFVFPLLISYVDKNPSHITSSFIMRFIKTLTRGINESIKDIEQNQISKLKKVISRKDFLVSECHTILDGILNHLHTVAEEDEQRSERSFKLLLEKNLALILSMLFEHGGELNRYRAAIFYRNDKDPLSLEYFTGVFRSNQDEYSKAPLPIKGSLGGKAYEKKKIVMFPNEKKPFQDRSRKYKSFMIVPIGINDDVEGILTIDCIDEDHRFNDPGIRQFLNVLSSILHLAGSIYRVE